MYTYMYTYTTRFYTLWNTMLIWFICVLETQIHIHMSSTNSIQNFPSRYEDTSSFWAGNWKYIRIGRLAALYSDRTGLKPFIMQFSWRKLIGCRDLILRKILFWRFIVFQKCISYFHDMYTYEKFCQH